MDTRFNGGACHIEIFDLITKSVSPSRILVLGYQVTIESVPSITRDFLVHSLITNAIHRVNHHEFLWPTYPCQLPTKSP